MPKPPEKGETKEEFMSRCVAYLKENEDRSSKKAAEVCFAMWSDAKEKSAKKKAEKRSEK